MDTPYPDIFVPVLYVYLVFLPNGNCAWDPRIPELTFMIINTSPIREVYLLVRTQDAYLHAPIQPTERAPTQTDGLFHYSPSQPMSRYRTAAIPKSISTKGQFAQQSLPFIPPQVDPLRNHTNQASPPPTHMFTPVPGIVVFFTHQSHKWPTIPRCGAPASQQFPCHD